ncbi:MAG: SH3 domain-containing protein [Chloroflexi bacterium]|nr:SH3 domain-containing protein [Chloroflexota bacterium]
MRVRPFLIPISLLLALSLGGCSFSLLGTPAATPFTFPTVPQVTPQPSATPVIPTQDLTLPSLTPTSSTPPPTPPGSPTPTNTPDPSLPYVILPGSPSGPYAVTLMTVADTLNIRSAPGVDNPLVGSFPASFTGVMRSGPSAWVDPSLWVEVQKPTGGPGWVNSAYLTEYITPAAFCADNRVTALLTDLGAVLHNGDGELLSGLVSPTHGMDVRLWRASPPVNFEPVFAQWVFISTWSHNWGAGASGADVLGSFHEVILPRLLEVYDASYTLTCNDPGVAATFSTQPWPEEYHNINYYALFKPATPGVDMDWRLWLVGVEYVLGKPYLFSLIHFQWEP